jgi:mono/diheme cytochrome c family protein
VTERFYGLIAAATMLFATLPTLAQAAAPDDGLRVFKSANCMGCHKWSGSGGGGYGGAAANLRHTELPLDQIEQTIRCGRPTTGMPHFESDAYSDGHCYGIKQGDLPAAQMPPEPDHPLRAADIQAVAKYVATQIKGKGNPTLAECQTFFGNSSRVCDIYAPQGAPDRTTPDGSARVQSAAAPIDEHAHVRVEAAPDANATK